MYTEIYKYIKWTYEQKIHARDLMFNIYYSFNIAWYLVLET